jgi:hypothetical protein
MRIEQGVEEWLVRIGGCGVVRRERREEREREERIESRNTCV